MYGLKEIYAQNTFGPGGVNDPRAKVQVKPETVAFVTQVIDDDPSVPEEVKAKAKEIVERMGSEGFTPPAPNPEVEAAVDQLVAGDISFSEAFTKSLPALRRDQDQDLKQSVSIEARARVSAVVDAANDFDHEAFVKAFVAMSMPAAVRMSIPEDRVNLMVDQVSKFIYEDGAALDLYQDVVSHMDTFEGADPTRVPISVGLTETIKRFENEVPERFFNGPLKDQLEEAFSVPATPAAQTQLNQPEVGNEKPFRHPVDLKVKVSTKDWSNEITVETRLVDGCPSAAKEETATFTNTTQAKIHLLDQVDKLVDASRALEDVDQPVFKGFVPVDEDDPFDEDWE
jgi:hypothetical protein